MKILFLTPYPFNEAPSQRFRFEQYANILHEKGFKLHFQSFLDSHNWHFFSKSGKRRQKTIALFKGFLKRCLVLFQARRYTFIVIHREATPAGPPVFEWILSRILKKKIIYDFDDAIWLTDRQNESFLLRTIKWRSKVRAICRWSYKISCGNDYLYTYAKQFNDNVILVPTTIDTEKMHNPDLFAKKNKTGVTIGWTGSHSTLKYLSVVEGILKKLTEKYDGLRILVIADQPPPIALRSLSFVPWSTKTEMADLLEMDIGIMPLPNDEWSKGKCGFKALQYMAMGIPTIASPVGVNTSIIDDTVNGFLCDSEHCWIDTLEKLIEDSSLRKEIGKKGREKVKASYSVASNSSTFLSLFG